MKKIDLHVHSNCSDGFHTPSELIKLAKKNKIDVLSITDHDNLEAYKIIEIEKLNKNIDIINGVEISSLYKGLDVHILSYHQNMNNSRLLETLEFIQNSRINRAKQMVTKLIKMGYKIDFDELITKISNPSAIGRPHIARYLIDTKQCITFYQVFDKLIGDNAPAYIAKKSLHPKEIIEIIHNAGGVAIIAHPAKLKNEFINLDLIEMGIDGLETYYFLHDKEQIDYYKAISKKYDLINTGGSDFHGYHHQVTDWGNLTIPEKCLVELKERSYKYAK